MLIFCNIAHLILLREGSVITKLSPNSTARAYYRRQVPPLGRGYQGLQLESSPLPFYSLQNLKELVRVLLRSEILFITFWTVWTPSIRSIPFYQFDPF